MRTTRNRAAIASQKREAIAPDSMGSFSVTIDQLPAAISGAAVADLHYEAGERSYRRAATMILPDMIAIG